MLGWKKQVWLFSLSLSVSLHEICGTGVKRNAVKSYDSLPLSNALPRDTLQAQHEANESLQHI